MHACNMVFLDALYIADAASEQGSSSNLCKEAEIKNLRNNHNAF